MMVDSMTPAAIVTASVDQNWLYERIRIATFVANVLVATIAAMIFQSFVVDVFLYLFVTGHKGKSISYYGCNIQKVA